MKWVYDLCGAEPIIKDMPVYSASTIDSGELLMLGAATLFSAGADASVALITAATDTAAANQGINAVGISLERKTTADSPSVAAAHNLTTGAGACAAKVIINPFAVYRAQLSTVGQAITAAGSSTTQQMACTAGATTGVFNGAYVFFANSAGSNFGQIRRIVTSASAATMVLDAVCLSAISSADTAVIFNVNPGKGSNTLGNGLATTGATLINQMSHAVNGATNFRQVETWIDRGNGVEKFTQQQFGGGRCNIGSTQAKITKIYQDIMLKDHAFGVDL